MEQSQKQLVRIIMRGAHDNGSHGSKCLMGLRPGKRRDCGNGAESRGLAAADSREAEPQREASYELSRDDQRAGNDHERREDTQKSPFAFSSRFLDPITTDIRTNPTASGNSGFSMASHLERCGSDFSMFGFSALADKSHGAACRYAQIHYAGRCWQ
ncbi:hypothetical protein [Bifidobacterium longum]|uniref:hypothetical protein n=2 Tax=Bifidobacterium longum TaxID=216816 RepID=UPI001BA8DD48|nr:hypothetical protein [Bifidobacterium longum]QUF87431.1 hypothetical protein KDJ92_04200 [Bifidobacterium longum subsp. infantis]